MVLICKGSSANLPAHWEGGARAHILSVLPSVRQKNFRAKPKQAGKREGGWGEGIFARLPSREAGLGGERLRSLAPSREAKQNIFQFLLEEKGSRAKIEKREKWFALRRRQAGGAAGRVNSVQNRFALRSVIATKLDFFQIQRQLVARSHRLWRVSLRKKPCISELN